MSYLFADRIEAGRLLARSLLHLQREDVVVAGIPRGGVPVAYEVAVALNAPLDVLLVRKLGHPRQPELAIGAIGEGGVRVLNPTFATDATISEDARRKTEIDELEELDRRVAAYRGGGDRVTLTGRSVVVVDDGLATGSSALAACEVAVSHGVARLTLAVPIAPRDWSPPTYIDEFVCVAAPAAFGSVGEWYRDFRPTNDSEVVELLALRRSELLDQR